MEGTEPPPCNVLPGLPRSRAIILGWVIATLFLPMLLALGLTGLCLGSPVLHYIGPRQKNAEKAAVRGKQAPGPGDQQCDPGGKAQASPG